MRKISSGEVRARLAGGAEHALFDVRREGEFAHDHLYFACNLPRALLEIKIERLVPRPATPIALYGGNEAEAVEAAGALEALGYRDVAVLDGGLEGWIEDGGQVFSGINVPSKAFGEFVEHAAGTPHVTPEALHDLLARRADVVVLDARPFPEYQAMNIPGAIDCPGAELVSRYGAYVRGADTLVVVNCAGRTRSIMGAQSLIDAGVPHRVVALRDGTMGWGLAGYDLERGQTRRAVRPSASAAVAARAQAEAVAGRAGVPRLEAHRIDAAMADETRTVYVFDVRDPEEYDAGHRPGAVSAPGAQLVQTLDSFVAVRNAQIVVTDSDGTRAPITAAWLRQMGEAHVVWAIDPNTDSTVPPPMPPRLAALVVRARKVTVAELADRIAARRARVIDLASSKEYTRGHIPSALFAERKDLAGLIADEPFVALTSPDGTLAAVAASDLDRDNVVALDGGTAAWTGAGRTLERSRGNLPENPDDVYYRPYDLAAHREEAARAYLDWEKGLLDSVMLELGVAFWRARP